MNATTATTYESFYAEVFAAAKEACAAADMTHLTHTQQSGRDTTEAHYLDAHLSVFIEPRRRNDFRRTPDFSQVVVTLKPTKSDTWYSKSFRASYGKITAQEFATKIAEAIAEKREFGRAAQARLAERQAREAQQHNALRAAIVAEMPSEADQAATAPDIDLPHVPIHPMDSVETELSVAADGRLRVTFKNTPAVTLDQARRILAILEEAK